MCINTSAPSTLTSQSLVKRKKNVFKNYKRGTGGSEETSSAGKMPQETAAVGKGIPTICTSSPGQSAALLRFPKQIGGGGGFIFYDVATGIVPRRLEYTTTSSEGAKTESLLLATASVIRPGMEIPFVNEDIIFIASDFCFLCYASKKS